MKTARSSTLDALSVCILQIAPEASATERIEVDA
jgi:hypothetical protein